MFFALYKKKHFISLSFRNFHTQTNVRSTLEEVGLRLGIKSFDQWYRVSPKDIEEHGGGIILRTLFGNNHVRAITTAFPEYQWKEWLFIERVSPLGDLNAQKKILFKIGERLKINHIEQWYSVSKKDVLKNGGRAILALYGYSVVKLLTSLVPEYDWKVWKFQKVPTKYWKELTHHREFFDDLAKKLEIKHWSDWKNVRIEDVVKNRGSGLLSEYYEYSIKKALQSIYPDIHWKSLAFQNNVYSHSSSSLPSSLSHSHSHSHSPSPLKSKTHIKVYWQLVDLFKDEDIHFNYKLRDHEFEGSGRAIELDIYIPKYKLGIEIQGQHHYQSSSRFGDVEYQRSKDEEKKRKCKEDNITLVTIPHWWNGLKDSLIVTIQLHTSHLFLPFPFSSSSSIVSPIPSTSPSTSPSVSPSTSPSSRKGGG